MAIALQAVEEREVIPRIESEFWTSLQRQASSLHEVSYRACFKPQLPRYFIERYTREDDLVYDPFMGRGTTLIEAALLGRRVAGNDVNPLCAILTLPRLHAPSVAEVHERLSAISLSHREAAELDLSMFFERRTLSEIVSLKNQLTQRRERGEEDDVDRWIRMVATNRLTGHSPGFFSVYTLPPNQATSPVRQKKINRLRRQKPEYRDVKALILKKTKSLLRNVTEEKRLRVSRVGGSAQLLSRAAHDTPSIENESVQLTVTSPPFLDIVHYSNDNWLRCWFNGIDDRLVARAVTTAKSVKEWESSMERVFHELFRITKPGGHVAFEVGEVRNGTVRLEEHVVPVGLRAGFRCEAILINRQTFTKTSNIWGISNNAGGTNTNRIVLFSKSPTAP
jgi:DNA modification methylase